MENLVKIFYKAYMQSLKGKKFEEPDGLSECESEFMKTLSDEQMQIFRKLEFLYSDMVELHDQRLITYFLNLLNDDEF